MYLSKIFFSWDIARNPYEIHRSVWKLFPEQQEGNRHFLFRIEQKIKRKGILILLQSMNMPAENSLNGKIIGVKEFLPVFRKGDQLRFRLYANPVKKIKDNKKRTNNRGDIKSCRVPLISPDDQRKWLYRKLEKSSEIQSLVIDGFDYILFYKNSGNHRGKIQPVLYDGTLKVKNPDILIEAMQKGIGPAKAFGCGLLSLARAGKCV